MMNKNLIVDAGFHDGTDTRFYLTKGYKVVAIDASVELYEKAREDLKEFIESGRLVLLNKLISSVSEKKQKFHLSRNTEWSSANRNLANRLGNFGETYLVDSVTLVDIFEEYGTPFYCKIDLEGMDIEAIKSLDRDHLPEYISCESECYPFLEKADPSVSLENLNALKALGYNKFKLVDQQSLFEMRKKKLIYAEGIMHKDWNLDRNETFMQRLMNKREHNFYRLSRKHNFRFTFGCSGPGPLNNSYLTKKSWLSYRRVSDLLLFYREQKLSFNNRNLWVDIYAKKS